MEGTDGVRSSNWGAYKLNDDLGKNDGKHKWMILILKRVMDRFSI